MHIKPLTDLGEYSKLETLDLTDNYIGELGQIKMLKIFRHLKHLSFRQVTNESQGSNPICDFDNYQVTCKMNCLSLKTLDGLAVDSPVTPLPKKELLQPIKRPEEAIIK